MTTSFRPVAEHELPQLLALYRHLNPDDPVLAVDAALHAHWRGMLAAPGMQVLAAVEGERLVASCTLVVIPNLTRGARPYALIENVVTDPGWRRRGIGTALLHHAQSLAWAAGCYKAMLMTSRKDAATLRFYEQAGFKAGDKTAFIARP